MQPGRAAARISGAIGGLLLFLFPVRAEWNVAAYLGGAHTNDSSLIIIQPATATNLTIHPVAYAAKPFQPPVYYGYRAGYFFSRYFGFDVEFTHLKAYAVTNRSAQLSGVLQGMPVNESRSLDSVVQRFNITHGVNLLTANFVARKMLARRGGAPRFVLSGSIGGGITIPHPENEVLGLSNTEHYQVGNPALQLAAGFEVRLWRKLSALSEFKYTRVDETVAVAQGAATSLLASVHVIAGVGWRF